ncbi:MAG: hypothetical protein ACLUOF_00275 [Ruminococcus sp.]
MVSGHYANIEQGTPLRSLLPADRFRTVSQETRDTVPLTPNEVAVTVVMKPAFVKRLHFPVPWDGILYGVVRKTELLRQLGTDADGKFWVKSISCNDWDDRFLLVLESEMQNAIELYVMADEVYDLLENCLRIPNRQMKMRTVCLSEL